MGDRDRLRHRVVAALVKGYRVLGATGMLRHPLIRRLHTHTYFAGKRSLEDHLAPFLTRFPSVIAGGHALDIGANIGYTSVVLARALSPGFRVFAFEPEQHNVETLRDNVRHFSVEKHVQVEAAAVGDHDGTAELWVNPGHPADHRILTSAFAATNPERASHQVAVVSIDSFVYYGTDDL